MQNDLIRLKDPHAWRFQFKAPYLGSFLNSNTAKSGTVNLNLKLSKFQSPEFPEQRPSQCVCIRNNLKFVPVLSKKAWLRHRLTKTAELADVEPQHEKRSLTGKVALFKWKFGPLIASVLGRWKLLERGKFLWISSIMSRLRIGFHGEN